MIRLINCNDFTIFVYTKDDLKKKEERVYKIAPILIFLKWSRGKENWMNNVACYCDSEQDCH